MKTKIIKSKKNTNIYEMFEDKIEVNTSRDKKVFFRLRNMGHILHLTCSMRYQC